jgi:serine-type D-Ala-D-Ala carboxypeptidase/endopeptidase
MILKNLGNKSKGGVSIVVGVITPNGTSLSGYGNISNTTKVNGDTIFNIGSNTKTFTTTRLTDMVKRGLVKLDDPVEKYLPDYQRVVSISCFQLSRFQRATTLHYVFFCSTQMTTLAIRGRINRSTFIVIML